MQCNNENCRSDQKVNCKIFGPKGAIPIVFIHGSGCDGSLWEMLADKLMPEFQSIAVDLPGHGGSAHITCGDTLKNYVEAVVKIIKTLGLEHPVIAGHSLGGAVSLTLALENPGLAGSLLMIGSGARLRVLPSIIEALKIDFDGALESVGQFSFSANAGTELVRAAREMMRRNGRDAMLMDFMACDSFDVMGRLGEIRVPVLAACGQSDALTPPKYSRFLADRIATCRMVTIQEAGHMVMLEKPDSLAKAVSDFLHSCS